MSGVRGGGGGGGGGGEGVRDWVISFLVWAKIFLQAYNFDRIFWC